jgi:hypothetical protein
MKMCTVCDAMADFCGDGSSSSIVTGNSSITISWSRNVMYQEFG